MEHTTGTPEPMLLSRSNPKGCAELKSAGTTLPGPTSRCLNRQSASGRLERISCLIFEPGCPLLPSRISRVSVAAGIRAHCFGPVLQSASQPQPWERWSGLPPRTPGVSRVERPPATSAHPEVARARNTTIRNFEGRNTFCGDMFSRAFWVFRLSKTFLSPDRQRDLRNQPTAGTLFSEGRFVCLQTNQFAIFFTIARFAGASKWCPVSESTERFIRKIEWSVLGGLGLSRRIPGMQSMCREVSAWESARDHHEYQRNL